MMGINYHKAVTILSSFITTLGLLITPSVYADASNTQSSTSVTAVAANQKAQTDSRANNAQTAKVGPDTEISPSNAPAPVIDDKLQRLNRVIFTFNDKVDTYFIKPVATFYNLIMPKPLNQGIHNVFNNIDEVPTIINDLLQFHFYQMTNDLWRLGINTTIGIGGLFDIATRIDLPPYQNDFGLTLVNYGYTNSTYLVLPFFGPYTIRDGLIGLPVDYYAFSVYPRIHHRATRDSILALYFLDRRAYALQFQPVIEEVAIDKYVFMRNAYMQHRTYQIQQNQLRGIVAATAVSSSHQ